MLNLLVNASLKCSPVVYNQLRPLPPIPSLLRCRFLLYLDHVHSPSTSHYLWHTNTQSSPSQKFEVLQGYYSENEK